MTDTFWSKATRIKSGIPNRSNRTKPKFEFTINILPQNQLALEHHPSRSNGEIHFSLEGESLNSFLSYSIVVTYLHVICTVCTYIIVRGSSALVSTSVRSITCWMKIGESLSTRIFWNVNVIWRVCFIKRQRRSNIVANDQMRPSNDWIRCWGDRSPNGERRSLFFWKFIISHRPRAFIFVRIGSGFLRNTRTIFWFKKLRVAFNVSFILLKLRDRKSALFGTSQCETITQKKLVPVHCSSRRSTNETSQWLVVISKSATGSSYKQR